MNDCINEEIKLNKDNHTVVGACSYRHNIIEEKSYLKACTKCGLEFPCLTRENEFIDFSHYSFPKKQYILEDIILIKKLIIFIKKKQS